MGRYRKNPVEIEAVQFTGDNWSEIQRFVGFHKSTDGYDIQTFNPIGTYKTSDDEEIVAEVWDKLHSTWVGVKKDQWVIKGIQGEFYPCDDYVFKQTYTKLEEFEYYDDKTLDKVHDALCENGFLPDDIPNVISSFQNAGILFRERK